MTQAPARKPFICHSFRVKDEPLSKPEVLRLPVSVPQRLLGNRRNFWKSEKTNLTTSFHKSVPMQVRRAVVGVMNEWAKVCGVRFKLVTTGGLFKVAMRLHDGFWAYEGKEGLGSNPSMNLALATLDDVHKYREYIIHEAGHLLGFGHEQFHPGIQSRLIPEKVVDYFHREYGWSADETYAQVLAPWPYDTKLPVPDVLSIMTYELPGELFVDGVGVPYASTLSATDAGVARNVYGPPLRPKKPV
jgi:hypothetical protein